MRVVRLSESCIIFKELSTDPAPIANSLNESPPPGLIEAVPAFNQLAIYFEPNVFQFNSPNSPLSISLLSPNSPLSVLMERGIGGEVDNSAPSLNGETTLQTRSRDLIEGQQVKTQFEAEFAPLPPLGEDLGGRKHNEAPNSSRNEKSLLRIIPALYNGPDLEASAKTLRMSIEAFIQIHSKAIYTVEAIGFCPGFPYLAGLPELLQNLPRKSTPRTAVEPGSIGITSDQCCIYPLVRPGGWNIIAQTPLTLVDPDSNYFPLQVGDKIQFQPITHSHFQEIKNNRL